MSRAQAEIDTIAHGYARAHPTNTDADLFVYTPTQAYYYLAAGRWFKASDLKGPWTYTTPDLPPDFANIPENSPAGRVLVSVPGTDDAKDAVLSAVSQRLRPVLMTAMLASLGLLPAAMSHANGSDTQRPFAIVIIGGLISSTLLTLLILPTLYELMYRWFGASMAKAEDQLP